MFWFYKLVSRFIFPKEKREAFLYGHFSHVGHRYCKLHKRYRAGIGSYWGHDCRISNKSTTIGKFCSIASYVSIGTTQHPTGYLSTHPFQYMDFFRLPGEIPQEDRVRYETSKPCRIGNDVWIGMFAVIMDGVSIGDGAIIGAHAVVTKDVPPYAIVGGVPAKLIRYRFSPESVDALLQLRWWDLPVEQIATLPFDDVPACISRLKEIRSEETGSAEEQK